MTEPREPPYVCGHSARELERLHAQGSFFQEISRLFLHRAGLQEGMSVLDIGCGVGDLTFLAAEIVGSSGSVLGVDRWPEAIATAGASAASRGLTQVDFLEADIHEMRIGAPVDALIGRFVLMHQADPASTLREAVGHLHPGGLVVLLESHLTASVEGVHSWPHSPTYDRLMRWIVDTIRATGAHPDMGLRLPRVFADAGLPAPKVWVQARVEGGPDAEIYSYITESWRSMWSLARGLGVLSRPFRELDDLERELRDEVTAGCGVLTSPLIVGAWCRLP